MKEKLIRELRAVLKKSAKPETRESSSRFFKKGEEALVYGVKTRAAIKLSKEFCNQVKQYSKEGIFETCEELWKSRYLEESLIACKLTEPLKKQYAPADFMIFEHWINDYVSNWAACDTFCNHTVGTFLMTYPQYVIELKKWAKSFNRWMKRASAVSLIIPAKKGLFLKEIFEIADILLLDKDDLVQKGYGWMLKAASHSNQDKVFEYVLSKREIMPRTALRYAIEKMPEEMKAEAMRK